MDMALLEVRNLTKKYKKFTLRDISFDLPAGYILGYIGRNGAGKTTTLNAVTHLIRPDGGSVTVDGLSFSEDPVAYRDSIGYIGDSSYFPTAMTSRDIRTILRDFYPSFDPDSFDGYVEKWELPEKEKISSYSRGMKVKLMFAAALSRKTKLLILDEATNGLDPMMRREILRILQEYIADGTKSVLFSTHILEDLQDIADYVFLIEKGEMVFCEAKDDLLESYLLVKGGREELTASLEDRLIGVERNEYGFKALFRTDDGDILPVGLAAEKPTIDQIVVHTLEGRKS